MHVRAQQEDLGRKPDLTDGAFLTLVLVLPTEVVKSAPNQLISFEKLVLPAKRSVNLSRS